MIDGDDYQRREAVLGAALMALVIRLMRKFGIPLTLPQRRQFAQRLLPELQAARQQSYLLASQYLPYAAELAHQPAPPIAPIAPYDADAIVSLLERTTGPVERLVAAVQAQTPRLSVAEAVEAAKTSPGVTITDLRTGLPIVDLDEDPSSPRVIYKIGTQTGAGAARHAGQAGRDAILRTAQDYGHRIGWARVTRSPNPCGFCAMLASRGPVYRTEASAGFKAHDWCDCYATIVYPGQPWDGEQEYLHWNKVWSHATKGLGGREARNAFRRAVHAEHRGHHFTATRPARNTRPDKFVKEAGTVKRAAAGHGHGAAHTESAADVAGRHLPTLKTNLESLRRKGFAEDSAPVQWHRKQIARHTAALSGRHH